MSSGPTRRGYVALLAPLLAVALLAPAGCGHLPVPAVEVNRQLDVFGVRLGSRTDHRTLQGVTAERQPCVLGYEYEFPSLAIRIGYTRRGAVRAVATRNPATAVLGVRPGASRAAAAARLADLGFRPGGQPDTYRGMGVVVSLLVDRDGEVFGVTAEVVDG